MSQLEQIQCCAAVFLRDTPLLDVRAPVEYARGAFPGAINIPLLDDKQRHLVGIEYKKAGRECAIALGDKLLPEDQRQSRIKQWLEFVEQHADGALYCFRGGLRSKITQQWLADAGCDYPVVSGGYKALRAVLGDGLRTLCQEFPLTLLGGRTGTGKTTLLQRISGAVDLEGLAHHRGSSFGALSEIQPSNIDFEHALSIELMKLRAANVSTVFLEDEGRMIGRVCLPELLRMAMQKSPVVILQLPLQQRIANVFEDYITNLLIHYQQSLGETVGFAAFVKHHQDGLFRVRKRLGGVRYKALAAMLDSAFSAHRKHGDTAGYVSCIEILLTQYYDPMYDYQLTCKQDRIVFQGDAASIVAWSRQSA